MRLFDKTTLMLATAILPFSTPLLAMEGMPMPSMASLSHSGTGVACHHLMTEKECASFLSTLSRLSRGEARNRFLADHYTLMREREALCNSNRANADVVIFYPRVEQLAKGS